MRYCQRCVLPETRPNLSIDENGVCNACRSFARRRTIDWAEREKLFANVVENARKQSTGYDCLIPVSGGKDSHWQVIKCLASGLRPLTVSWKTPVRTEIGQRNLDNLIHLGVDHIDYQINPEVERIFMRKALKRFGSPAIPMHMAIFSIPLTIATRLGIPLVVWGENSAFEYGEADERHTGFRLTAEWLRTYGVTHGTAAIDWVDDELTKGKLTPYFCPDETELAKNNVQAVFLGYYFQWDPSETYRTARDHGFREREAGPVVGLYDYADIDDEFIISIHHHLKWHKFGFTRLFDNLALEIRHGRLTRDAALKIIKKSGNPEPEREISKLCTYLDITETEFKAMVEPFRNKEIWREEDGIWQIDDFIVADWNWK